LKKKSASVSHPEQVPSQTAAAIVVQKMFDESDAEESCVADLDWKKYGAAGYTLTPPLRSTSPPQTLNIPKLDGNASNSESGFVYNSDYDEFNNADNNNNELSDQKSNNNMSRLTIQTSNKGSNALPSSPPSPQQKALTPRRHKLQNSAAMQKLGSWLGFTSSEQTQVSHSRKSSRQDLFAQEIETEGHPINMHQIALSLNVLAKQGFYSNKDAAAASTPVTTPVPSTPNDLQNKSRRSMVDLMENITQPVPGIPAFRMNKSMPSQ